MATLAKLTIDLLGDSANLTKELRKANKNTKNWADKTRNQIGVASKAFAGIALTGSAALTAIYSQSAASADQLAKFSDQLGEAPERITALQHAAELTGVSTEKMGSSLERMAKRIGEARNNTGAAVKTLQQLGLSTQGFFNLSPADQFSEIAEKINKLGTQQEKAAAAAAIFGREGVALLNTMALGKDGISAMEREAQQLGITLNRVELAKIEAANDSFHRAKQTASAFGKSLAVEVSPLVGAMSNRFVQAAKDAGGFGAIASRSLKSVVKGVGFVADAVRGLEVVWKGLKLVVVNYYDFVLSGLVKLDNAITDFVNKIPGVAATQSESLKRIGNTLSEMAAEASTDFNNAILAPMPSETIKNWVDDVIETANKEAEQAAEKSKVGQNLLAGNSGETNNPADETNNNDKIQRDLEDVRQFTLSKIDIINEAEQRRLEILSQARETDLISEDRYQQLSTEVLKKSALERQKIQTTETSMILQSSGQLFDSLAGLAETFKGKQSKTYKLMFAASKAFSIADSIIKIQQGIASAAATPFPLNIGAMATVAAATAGIVSTIQSVKMKSFAGGGFTGDGPRSGGLDGQGGFFAMLHPKETVIDHTKNNQQPAGNTNYFRANFNIYAQDTVSGIVQNKSLIANIVRQAMIEGAVTPRF